MNNRFSKLFLVGVACAAFFVRSHAPAATYYFDLHAKTLEGGTMALGENAELVLRNIGTADPAALRTLLCDKEGHYLAASTNGFRADGTAAVGDMSLATAALAARFDGMGVLKEIPLVFAIWDTANGTLLGSSLVQVKNNPLANADGSVPMNWGGVDYGDVAIAQQAYSMATNAWQLSVATSNRMDALHGDYTAATNDLWEAVGGLESGTGALGDRIAALEGADFGGAISSSADSLRDELLDAMESDIEAAFTNGTAKGLAVAMPEAWAEADADDGLEASPFAGALRVVGSQSRSIPRQLWLESTLNLLGLSLVSDGDEVAGISLRREAVGGGGGYISIYAPGGVRTATDIHAGSLTLDGETIDNWGALTNGIGPLQSATEGLAGRMDSAEDRIGGLETGMESAQGGIAGLEDAMAGAAEGIAANAAAIESMRTDEFLPRRGYEYDAEDVPTNLTWKFEKDGTYINDLDVGGWERFVTVTNDGVPQTIVLRHTGRLGLNGRKIDSWDALTNGLASMTWAQSLVAEYTQANRPDLSGYATLDDLENVSVDLSEVYVRIGEVADSIPSLDGYATQPWTMEYVRTIRPSMDGYATEGFVTNAVGTLSNMLAGIEVTGEVDLTGVATSLASLREDVDAAAGAAYTNSVQIDDLRDSTLGLDNAVVALENDLGGYVAKTNGEWVVVQSVLWNGLRWEGRDLFGAALLVEPGQARITGFGVDPNGTATITFLGSETTNRLEATTDAEEWENWNDCFWSYNGPTGTVAVVNAREGAFYRIVAVDGAPGATTNAVMVSSVPMYIGDPSDSANRVATMADLPNAVDRVVRTRGATAKSLQPTGWEDPMNVEPKLLGWQFSPTGTYFKALTIGGHRYDEGGTNFLANGEVTLNGERIRHWAEIAAYAEGASLGVGTLNTLEGDVALEAGEGITITLDAQLGTITIESDATGSGFPLEADADFAGHAAENVGSIQFAGSTNELAIIDGKLKYGGKSVSGIPNLEAGRNIELAVDTTNEVVTISTTDDADFHDLTIRGDLHVYGTEYHTRVIHEDTRIDRGVWTNNITYNHYQTNNVYEHVYVVTRTTNNVDEVVNIGGDVDHSRAATVLSPSYSIDNHDTNAPTLSATGFWDYTLASLALGTNAVSSFNGWTGAVGIQAGSNITFGTDDANRRITINATVPEIDLSGYATAANLSGVAARVGAVETNIANHSGGMTNYVTGQELDAKLAEYAPASEINIIADDIDEIVSALSNPVIETPDHKKWAMQGRYSNGQVTHVWVPYLGARSTPIRVAMPDGRIFEMVGRYADGNTNIITHAWEEVTE